MNEDELQGFKKALKLLDDFYERYKSRDDLSKDFLTGFGQAITILSSTLELSDYFDIN